MKKIIELFKKYSWIWIVIIVLVSIFSDIYIQKIKNVPLVSPTPISKIASYKNIIPNISTEEDLNKILGSPLKTIIKNTEKTDEYMSNSELRRHTALIQNEKVIFFKEIISASDTTRANDIISIYGLAPNILYSKYPNATFDLYVYPLNGISYLGHKDGGLLEIWYFEPTTIEGFMSKWASDYSLTKPDNKNSY